MITFIGVTIINLVVWIPTIIRSENKLRTAAVATVNYALSLSASAATRYLLTL